ncbi:MAG: hypothetical protein Q8L23_13715 [Caulobacter sp.]|nr:hypothetical protein [Caulobacter sp.]
MSRDHRNPLIEGPRTWRWPWDRSKDVIIGGQVRAPAGPVEKLEARLPGAKPPAAAHLDRMYGGREQAPFWKRWPVQAVLLLALLYHLAPRAALFLGGGESPEAARGVLTFLGPLLPRVFDVETREWLVPGAAAWLWQPLIAALGVGFLRLVALSTARRDPLGALWIGGVALAVDTATWILVGVKLGRQAYSPAEAAALTTLLKVEGMALLGLFFILALTGKRRLGRTGAGGNGD